MKGILLSSPMDIIHEGVTIWKNTDLFSLGFTLQRGAILLATVSMAMSLVGIIFSNNPQGVSENKKDIVNKLIVIFIVSNLVLIFNGLKSVFDTVF